MPESLIGRGEFFALIAKGESMVDARVKPGDYVIVRRQQTAEHKDIVVALLEGKNNLKIYIKEDGKCILRSKNRKHKKLYPDIVVGEDEELRIQGLAVGVYHKFGKADVEDENDDE
jgi:repressor LexA